MSINKLSHVLNGLEAACIYKATCTLRRNQRVPSLSIHSWLKLRPWCADSKGRKSLKPGWTLYAFCKSWTDPSGRQSLQNQSSKSQGKTHREYQNPELLKYIINYVQFSRTKNYATCNQIGKCDISGGSN